MDYLTLAYTTYGFLIPWRQEITGNEFAALMLSYSSHPRTIFLANVVSSSAYTFRGKVR